MRQVDTYNREELDNFTNFITLVKKARKFATEAHKGVYRRGVDKNGVKLDYITHPIAVAKILHQHKSSHKIGPLVVACLLHDAVEDVEWVTIEVIKLNFGSLVASLVEELTSDPKGIEAYGKQDYLLMKMTTMSSWGLGIKLADRLHNLSDVQTKLDGGKQSDINWCVKYCNQTDYIIEGLERGRTLSNTHKRLIEKIKKTIKPALDLR